MYIKGKLTKNTVSYESHIIRRDKKPGKPQQAIGARCQCYTTISILVNKVHEPKITNVRLEAAMICNLSILGKDSIIGSKEKIIEEF